MVGYIVTFNEAGSTNIGDVAIHAGLLNCLRGLDVSKSRVLSVGLQSGQRITHAPTPVPATRPRTGNMLDRLPSALYWAMWVCRYVLRFLRLRHDLKGADLFLVGGGGIVMDNKCQFATAMAIVATFAKLYDIPIACLGVSASASGGPLSTRLFRFALRRMDMVQARDEESRLIIEKLAGIACGVCGDFAFTSVRIADRLSPSLVLLNVSSLVSMSKSEYFRWLGNIVREHSFAEVRLFTTGDPEDLDVAREFAAFEGRNLVVVHCAQLADYVSLLEQSRLVLASRLHAGILALAAGVPCAMLAVGNKQRSFFRSVGLGTHVLELPAVHAGTDFSVSVSELRGRQIEMCRASVRSALAMVRSGGAAALLPSMTDRDN